MKELGLEKRLKYAELVVALANGDKEEALACSRRMGLRTKRMNGDVIHRLLCFFHDRDTEDVTEGMNIQQFMDWTNAEDPIVELDDDYVLVGRVSLLLRGLGNAFNMKLRVTPYWRREAQRLLNTTY